MAVLGVKDQGWYGVDSFPSKLSNILKFARFFVLRYSFEQSFLSLEENSDTGDDSTDSEASETSETSETSDLTWIFQPIISGSLNRLKYLMNHFMVRGTYSFVNYVIDLRAYGITIARETTSFGQINWVKETIFFNTVSFSILAYRSFIYGLDTSTRGILLDDILFRSTGNLAEIPAIPWEKFRENPLDTSPFFNFLDVPNTDLGVTDPKLWLYDRISQNTNLVNQFQVPGTTFAWNRKKLEGYFKKITGFLERLMLLMHITGGQPPRAPELFSIMFGNSNETGIRNIFYENGLVVFVTYYHKGYTISGSTKIIYRYFPQAIGELLVYYL